MTTFNLPTIDFDISSGSNKQELQQILDALTKYRKELNFLLMNLDVENMPTVGGLIEDTLGNYSLLTQTVDGIQSTVSSQGTLITNQGTTIGTHTSQITQLGSDISSVVSFTDVDGNDIASLINQTATTIDILASRIELTGITSIYGADTGDKVVVKDGEIAMYIDGTRYLDFSSNTDGATISPYTGSNIVILGDLLVDGDIYSSDDLYLTDNAYIDGNVDIEGNLDVGGELEVDGDPVVTSNYNITLNATTYGVDIRRDGYDSITLEWGANVSA